MNTSDQYLLQVQQCKSIFLKKTSDYGTAWRVLRTISVIDQIFIKAHRIRNIQEGVVQQVQDDVHCEWQGIVNYGVIGLIQLQLTCDDYSDIAVNEVNKMYDQQIAFALNTMLSKNNDYGEAWRSMSQQSLTDLILMKLLRVKQILLNNGQTLVSEGIDANYTDIINYAVFALILQEESKN